MLARRREGLAGAQRPPAERARAWISEHSPKQDVDCVSSGRAQTNTASPSGSAATWGARALSGSPRGGYGSKGVRCNSSSRRPMPRRRPHHRFRRLRAGESSPWSPRRRGPESRPGRPTSGRGPGRGSNRWRDTERSGCAGPRRRPRCPLGPPRAADRLRSRQGRRESGQGSFGSPNRFLTRNRRITAWAATEGT
jgi:hypothetical protein